MTSQGAVSTTVADSARTGAVVHSEGVCVDFPTAEGELRVLEDVSVSIPAGQFVSLLGPSGCGKSTFLNAVAGLVPISAGEIEVGGSPLTGINGRAGYMFQEDTLLPWASALDNVLLPMRVSRQVDVAHPTVVVETFGQYDDIVARDDDGRWKIVSKQMTVGQRDRRVLSS